MRDRNHGSLRSCEGEWAIAMSSLKIKNCSIKINAATGKKPMQKSVQNAQTIPIPAIIRVIMFPLVKGAEDEGVNWEVESCCFSSRRNSASLSESRMEENLGSSIHSVCRFKVRECIGRGCSLLRKRGRQRLGRQFKGKINKLGVIAGNCRKK